MVDWLNIFFHTLWILGLALGLAVLSMARFEAHAQSRKTIDVLNQPGKQSVLCLAGILFCAGMILTSQRVWENVVWLVLVALLILKILLEKLRVS